MGTNSHIFYEDNVGVYRGISCNFDGGLNGVGITLYQHYQNISKIKELISLGSISSLDKECMPSPQYYSMDMDRKGSMQFGYTCAYHRDLEQPYIKPTIKNSLSEMEKYYHVYVWSNNQWYSFNAEQSQWKILKEELLEFYNEKATQYLIEPKTVEINLSHEEYMDNIRRGFLLVKKDKIVYQLKDYIKFKAVKEEKTYELLVKVIEVIENEAIKEDYQLVILSRPPENIAWFYPVTYPTAA